MAYALYPIHSGGRTADKPFRTMSYAFTTTLHVTPCSLNSPSASPLPQPNATQKPTIPPPNSPRTIIVLHNPVPLLHLSLIHSLSISWPKSLSPTHITQYLPTPPSNSFPQVHNVSHLPNLHPPPDPLPGPRPLVNLPHLPLHLPPSASIQDLRVPSSQWLTIHLRSRPRGYRTHPHPHRPRLLLGLTQQSTIDTRPLCRLASSSSHPSPPFGYQRCHSAPQPVPPSR